MLFLSIVMVLVTEIKEMVIELKKEGGPLDDDSPNELTREEISFVITKHLLAMAPKIIAIVSPKK